MLVGQDETVVLEEAAAMEEVAADSQEEQLELRATTTE